MLRALTVAYHIINRCNEKGKSISNLKLQKILYFVQAQFLVAKNEPCFTEEIEAWDFGPVVPSVYRAFKVYGSASIPYIENDGFIYPDDCELMDKIIDQCSEYSASALVEITHHQKPWMDAYLPNTNTIISTESIKSFFEEG